MQQTQNKTITLNELKEKLHGNNPPVLLNVLSEESFAKNGGLRLPNSHWIPNAELEKKAQLMFAKNREIITYCGGFECTASDKAQETLQSLGYTNVRAYKGGLQEWKQAGLPMEANQESSGCCGGSCG